MTREERVKICETCKHCQKDIERGILCGLTNEYADFDDKCHLYEPSEKQQVKTRARRIIARMKESSKSSDKGLSFDGYIAIIGTYLFCLISMLVGDDAKSSIIIPLCLAIGFMFVALICLDYYYLKYKRKKKVFGELTSSAIEQIIKIEGFYPYKENGDIYFKSESIIYRIIHKAPQFSLLLQGPFQGYYKIALLAAAKVMNDTIVGKIEILEQSGKSSQLFISFSVEGFIHYVDELRVNFSSYFKIINIMHAQFLDEYHKLEEVEQAHNPLYDTTLIN
ncbi:MAG: hypothetical protein KHW57_08480 [Clostridium sp.]|nr:hypothetical protein [Clostridium sp.]